eukprot:GFKZ01015707.1.p2 GENE.GFKZ01015707.1~~GFKZ01015707.1.p2  ORF type:complete len:141 (-),score=11.02 GFKZ01015707.1:57-479(-)
MEERRDAIVQVLGTNLYETAFVGVDYEVKYLLPSLHARLTDILMHPRSSSADSLPPLPELLHVTASCPFQLSFLYTATRPPQAVSNTADRRKIRAFAAKVAAVPGEAPPTPSKLGRKVVPQPSIPWEHRPPAPTTSSGNT